MRARLLSRSDSSRLSPPKKPVSETLGNMAARATPICALAEARNCSACRTSGRRSSRLEGSPAGGTGRHRQAAHHARGHRNTGLAGQQGHLRLGQRALALELTQLDRRVDAQGLRLVEVEPRGGPALQAHREQALALLARGQGFARDHDLLVERAQREVGLRDQPDDGLPHHLAAVGTRQGLGTRRFGGAPQLAPEVELEGADRREPEVVARAWPGKPASSLVRSRVALPSRSTLGYCAAVAWRSDGRGLLDPCHGLLDVGVVLLGLVDQRIQFRVVEERPPLGGHRLGLARRGQSDGIGRYCAGSWTSGRL